MNHLLFSSQLFTVLSFISDSRQFIIEIHFAPISVQRSRAADKAKFLLYTITYGKKLTILEFQYLLSKKLRI